ncbi:MAG: hypothetical protein JRG73_13665 [Deltaproteobacteria bacterium]|nr:hypothetical protein [Deltaproteobacteria bacterium]
MFVIAGTVALAFSVRIQSQHKGEAAKIVEKAKKEKPGLFAPKETYIVRPLFWGGLALIAIGTILQW